MENQRILIDTSIFVDYFRKQKKQRAILYSLSNEYRLSTSVICYFEFCVGSKEKDKDFLHALFHEIEISDFDKIIAIKASNLYKMLKSKNQLIDFRDLFIAATAITNNMPLATLNVKHFERVEELELLPIK